MNDKSREVTDIVGVLGDMERLLRASGEPERADYLIALIQSVESDPAAAMQSLLGIDFWGGAGSYFDLWIRLGPRWTPSMDLSEVNRKPTEAELALNREYCAAMLRLLRALEAEGYTRPDFPMIEQFLVENS